MKKFWKVLTLFAAAAAIVPLTACDDEDYNSQYATITFKANGEFLQSLANPLALTNVRCTKPAPADIQVEVAIDPTLVDEYNAANKTECAFLDKTSLTKTSFTIPKGEFMSADSIKVNFANHEGLVGQEQDLLLPIVIKATTGGKISTHSRMFIHFDYNANNVYMVEEVALDAGKKKADWDNFFSQPVNVGDAVVSSWPADAEITVTFEIDNNLVNGYNASHKSNYKTMEGVRLASATSTIAVGKDLTSFSIVGGDYSEMGGEGYVVPVKISAVSGSGATIKESENVCYVVITKTLPKVLNATSLGIAMTGTLLPYDGSQPWTITVNGNENSDGTPWSDLFFDNAFIDYWNTGDVILIDLGQAYKLEGIRAKWYSGGYRMYSIKAFETSVDGNKWDKYDVSEFSASNSTNPYNIFLKDAGEIRYIKWTAGDSYYKYAGVGNYGSFPKGLGFYELP